MRPSNSEPAVAIVSIRRLSDSTVMMRMNSRLSLDRRRFHGLRRAEAYPEIACACRGTRPAGGEQRFAPKERQRALGWGVHAAHEQGADGLPQAAGTRLNRLVAVRRAEHAVVVVVHQAMHRLTQLPRQARGAGCPCRRDRRLCIHASASAIVLDTQLLSLPASTFSFADTSELNIVVVLSLPTMSSHAIAAALV